MVIDPIDGSLNARRTLPSFALSVAVATGPSMADVELAYVWDFGADEEFVALHGGGARLDGEELLARGPGYGLEVVGLEATKPELIAPIVAGLEGKAYRLRGIGSLALTRLLRRRRTIRRNAQRAPEPLRRRRRCAADRARGRRER